MILRKIGFSAAIAATVAVGAGSAAQATTNIVTNPGFETGNLNGWGYNFGWIVESNFWNVTPPADGGKYFASTGCPTYYCTLSQTLPTTQGALYRLTFEFNPGDGVRTGGGDTQVRWNGRQVLDIGLGPNAWTTYTVNGLVGSGSDMLTFFGYQYPGFNGLDNVSVTQTSPGPNIGEGLVGFAAMSALLIAIRYRGLVV
jgi:hypothetical protein